MQFSLLMESVCRAMNGVVAPAMTPSQVKPKKRTTILFMLYTAHTRKHIRSATEPREMRKQVHIIISSDLQLAMCPMCVSVKGNIERHVGVGPYTYAVGCLL